MWWLKDIGIQGECQVSTEAEIGMMCLQDEECQRLHATTSK